MSKDHHREGPGDTGLFHLTKLELCGSVVLCAVHSEAHFAVLGETILLLTSSLWNKAHLVIFITDLPGHPSFQLGPCQVGVI